MTKDFIFDLYIDTKTKISPKIWVVKGDSKGNRFLITLKDKEGHEIKDVDLSKASFITIVFSKEDGNVVIGNAVITDVTHGKIEYIIQGNEIAFVGNVECEVQVYGDNNSRYTTTRFTFEVRESLDSDDAVESTTEYPILNTLISTVETILDVEALRVEAENTRAQDESNRQSAEGVRVTNEEERLANKAELEYLINHLYGQNFGDMYTSLYDPQRSGKVLSSAQADNATTLQCLYPSQIRVIDFEDLYIDATNGNDNNDGLTTQAPVKTFGKVAEIINGNDIKTSLTLHVADGDYSTESEVIFKDIGSSFTVDPLNYGDVLYPNTFKFNNCTNISVSGGKTQTINITNCLYAYVSNMVLDNETNSSSIFFSGSSGYVQSCTFNGYGGYNSCVSSDCSKVSIESPVIIGQINRGVSVSGGGHIHLETENAFDGATKKILNNGGIVTYNSGDYVVEILDPPRLSNSVWFQEVEEW